MLTEDLQDRARFGMSLPHKHFEQDGAQAFGWRSVAFPRVAGRLTEPGLSPVRS